jgi:hypothetical protein
VLRISSFRSWTCKACKCKCKDLHDRNCSYEFISEDTDIAQIQDWIVHTWKVSDKQ